MKMFNRMEPPGPNRKIMKSILENDRKIVAHIVISSAAKVLKDQFGFNDSQIKDFQDSLKEEIKKS